MTAPATFCVRYAPELRQYVVECGAVRIVPSIWPEGVAEDRDAAVRAAELCGVLNRVYGVAATPQPGATDA